MLHMNSRSRQNGLEFIFLYVNSIFCPTCGLVLTYILLQTEHIDNPKGYAEGDDARRYHPQLRGPVDVCAYFL